MEIEVIVPDGGLQQLVSQVLEFALHQMDLDIQAATAQTLSYRDRSILVQSDTTTVDSVHAFRLHEEYMDHRDRVGLNPTHEQILLLRRMADICYEETGELLSGAMHFGARAVVL